MTRRPSLRLGVAAALLLSSLAGASADEVALRGGTRLRGVVLAQDEAGVRLLLPGGEEIRLAAADVGKVERDPEAPTGEQFLRFVDDAEGTRLQTAVVHLAAKDRPRVDLIGAVHIADRAYYRKVQGLLEAADLVLFEMVKPKGVEVEETGPNPIREFQVKLGKALDLLFQIDEIDYDRPHFVNADLTPEELAGPEAPGTEAPSDAPPSEGGDGKAPPAPPLPPEIQRILPMLRTASGLLDALGAGAAAQKADLKRMVARVVGNLGPRAATLLGPRMSEMLITRRNAVVVARLRDVPEDARSVAVFYGAAHLPDLEQRIVKELGYERVGGSWLDAWRIPPPKGATRPADAKGAPSPEEEPAEPATR